MGKYSLNPGDTASSITLPVWPEGELKLSDLRGQWVILYFYPMVHVKEHVENVLNTPGKLQT